MIHIYADRYQTSRPREGALLVTSVGAYVAARQAIRVALDTNRDVSLYVTDPVALQWLSDMQRYPTSVVTWHDLRPEAIFERLFGMPPQPPFSVDVLAKLDLERLSPPPPTAESDPLGWILAQRLDSLWGYAAPPKDHLSRVIAWAAPQEAWNPGVLAPLLDHQLQRWAEDDARWGALCALTLPGDARKLLTRTALSRYDQAWRQNHPWGTVPELPVEGLELLAAEALRPLHGQIAAYWNDRYARSGQSADMIAALLDQASGLSMAEADALDWMFDRHPERLTARLLARIEQRFAHLAAVRSWITLLRRRVAPPPASLPDSTWDTAHWLRWATGEYLPYFAWTLRAGQQRDHQQHCAGLFADWVYTRYPHWLNDDTAPLGRRQHYQMRELLERDPNAIIFWLVIDGMAWWHGEMLRPLCAQHGLYIHEHTAALAALPSITSIAKRALVTGMATVDLDEPTVADAARAHFVRSGVAARVTYKIPEALKALQEGRTRCIVVLYNSIDDLAHKTREMTDAPGFRGHLEQLVEALARARDLAIRQGCALHILIGSDHGGTLLADDAEALPLPRSTHPIEETLEDAPAQPEAQPRSARAAIIDDPTLIPADQRNGWYILDRDRFQLDQHYLAPRGYAFIKRRPSGWTHGGLTPEELIVPLLHLTPEAPTILPLKVSFSGSLLPRKESVAQITLVNANRFPLDQIVLELDGEEWARLDQIAAADSTTLELLLPSVLSQATTVPIHWRVRSRAFGVARDDEGQTTLPVRRLSTEDSSIDDMFGDL